MKVFISWSGEVSKIVALKLKEWLPDVIQAVEPFISSEDIQKGSPWFNEIGKKLEETNLGILCLAAENLSEPWILFEAGALSKNLGQSRVVPLLIDIKIADLEGPLAQFNATLFNKEDIQKLTITINRQMGEKALEEPRLNKTFERCWPDLEESYRKALELAKRVQKGDIRPPRKIDDILEEILLLSRRIDYQLGKIKPPLSAEILAGTSIDDKSSQPTLKDLHNLKDFIDQIPIFRTQQASKEKKDQGSA